MTLRFLPIALKFGSARWEASWCESETMEIRSTTRLASYILHMIELLSAKGRPCSISDRSGTVREVHLKKRLRPWIE